MIPYKSFDVALRVYSATTHYITQKKKCQFSPAQNVFILTNNFLVKNDKIANIHARTDRDLEKQSFTNTESVCKSEYSMDEMGNNNWNVVEIHIKTGELIRICGKSSQNIYSFAVANMV